MRLPLLLFAWVLLSLLPVKLTADAFDAKHNHILSCLLGIILALAVAIAIKTFFPLGTLTPAIILLAAGVVYMIILGVALYRGIIVALVQLAVTFLAFLVSTAVLGSSMRIPLW